MADASAVPGAPSAPDAPATGDPAGVPSEPDDRSEAASAPPAEPHGAPPPVTFNDGEARHERDEAVASPRIYEPPTPDSVPAVAPPKPRHTAPERSLWVGVRSGWFVPFGDLWGSCTARDLYGDCLDVSAVHWRGYAHNGGLAELDVGARLSRNYNLFGLWERGWLSQGSMRASSGGGTTDYFAIGLRATTDADKLGLLTEFAIGWRTASAELDDGRRLELGQGLFEGRFGVGADIRVSPTLSLSPMLTLGVGEFRSAEIVDKDGTRHKAIPAGNDPLSHGWLTLQLGGHFDLWAHP